MIARQRVGRYATAAAMSLVFAAASACGPSAGLSENSTCKDFLAASAQDQQSITQQLAGRYQKPDYATPLGMPEVPYACAADPSMTLKQFFQRAQ